MINQLRGSADLNYSEIAGLLALENEPAWDEIFKIADNVRSIEVGNEVHLQGVIDFSNVCQRNCLYCGIRRDNSIVIRYRMMIDEIIETAVNAENLGYRSIVLQSGDDPYYTTERIIQLIQAIKQKTSLVITLAIGERDRDEYLRFFEAGVDRYQLRFETSNPDLFLKLHPDFDYDERFRILEWLKYVGYQVGSGVMVGLPGQSYEDLAQDIKRFQELNLDLIGVGPYLVHKQTPLAGCESGTAEMTLRMIALTRIITRNTDIPATAALASLSTLNKNENGLQVGANVLMLNVTPVRYRSLYELYPAKICIQAGAEKCRTCIEGKISAWGRAVGSGGQHINYNI